MSDTDPLPRPPRRRINGVTWEWPSIWNNTSGEVLGWSKETGFARMGFTMGCVKDDDGTLPDRFTEEAG